MYACVRACVRGEGAGIHKLSLTRVITSLYKNRLMDECIMHEAKYQQQPSHALHIESYLVIEQTTNNNRSIKRNGHL